NTSQVIYTTSSGQKVTTQDVGYSDEAKKVINDANKAVKEEIKGVKKALVAETKSLVKEGKELLKDPVGTIVNYGKDKAKEELKKLASGKIELNGVMGKIDIDLKEQKLNFDIGVPYVAAIKGSLDRNGYAGASTEKVEEENGVVDKGVKREVDLKNGTYKRTSETSTIEVDAKNKSMGYKGVNGTTMSYANEGKEVSLGTSQSSMTVSGENKSFSYTGKDENFSLDTKGNMSVENSNGTKVEVDSKNKSVNIKMKNVSNLGNVDVKFNGNGDVKSINNYSTWEGSIEKGFVDASVTVYESDTSKVEATGGFSIKNGLNAGARGNVEGEKAAYTGDVKVHVSTGTLAVVGVAVAVESGVVGALSEGGAIAAEAIAGVATYGKSALNTISNYIPEGLKFSY
ncbi:MAG: hypothetical protein JXM74_00090, partial [Fusobacteriaceae bacterium]|nr:hypothetical protein [Fusobacteriaceae bacterium]